MIYGLFERVYILHEKRWIDDASWREWATWIEVMCRNPIFTHVHTISRGMFNASFQEYLTGLMPSSSVADGARSRAPQSGEIVLHFECETFGIDHGCPASPRSS